MHIFILGLRLAFKDVKYLNSLLDYNIRLAQA